VRRGAAGPALARALACALALPACDGYRLVEPTPPPAGFSVQLGVVHDDSARYTVRAFFQFGVDSLGRTVTLRDSALLVDGVPVPPTVGGGGAYLAYEWTEVRASAAPRAGTIAVRGPVPTSSDAPAFALPVVARDGPRALAVSGSEDLVLRLVPPPPGAALYQDSWALEVSDAAAPSGSVGRLLSTQVTGRLPAEVRVPRALLPEPLPARLAASVTGFALVARRLAPFPTVATIYWSLDWRRAP
jgi:hypothetical protein